MIRLPGGNALLAVAQTPAGQMSFGRLALAKPHASHAKAVEIAIAAVRALHYDTERQHHVSMLGVAVDTLRRALATKSDPARLTLKLFDIDKQVVVSTTTALDDDERNFLSAALSQYVSDAPRQGSCG